MADFTGFYFNNVHSSTYHLIRTSDGDRYGENLFPAFNDHTVELVGGHGNIYSDTRYKEKEFSISVAFDSVTEQDFRAIKQWLTPDKIGELRFDEAPYKAYQAKLKTSPKFDYLCFMEEKEDGFIGEKERIYKGEATLDFIAYNPFGYCCDNTTKMTINGLETVEDGINWQVLDSYNPFNVKDDNITEWGLTSGLMNKVYLKDYGTFSPEESENGNITLTTKLYNPGDFDADFELFINPNYNYSSDVPIEIYLYEKDKTEPLYVLIFSARDIKKTAYGQDCILINTKNHSLKLISHMKIDPITQNQILDKTALLRYDLINQKTLEWLRVPKGESTIKIVFKNIDTTPSAAIKYNYKYY